MLAIWIQDVPLFEGIISDLFPGVEKPQPDFGVFLESIKDAIQKKKIQPVPWFIEKIIQVRTLFRSQIGYSHNINVAVACDNVLTICLNDTFDILLIFSFTRVANNIAFFTDLLSSKILTVYELK